MGVAETTIKTHFRNVYKKVGVAHLKDAVHIAKIFLNILGYVFFFCAALCRHPGHLPLGVGEHFVGGVSAAPPDTTASTI
ncbi:LuxR C-terminal-related transcriptional regulator, partial [Enterobacter intestinihominis]